MNRQPKTRKFLCNPALERLEPRLLLSGQPMISELMAINSTTLADEDGAYSDWLEIHNPDAAAVDLTGWKLKDGGNEWVFPGMSLGPGEFRVIFASGKDRRDPAGELHTNFSLKGSGEYLGLLDETGAVVHEYDEYPEQTADISYGIAQDIETTRFVASGDTAAYLIPDADPGAWTALGFDDTDWPAGQTALGYADTVDGFAVWNYKANTSVGHLDTALQVLANPGMQSYVNSENAPFVNYYNSGGNGHYTAGQVDFPGFTGLVDDFVVEAKAFVTIPSAGEWSFGVNSDDGFLLTVTGAVTTAVGNSDIPAGSDTISYAAPRGTADTLGVFDFPAAGTYEIRSVMYERGGGSAFEIFAAPGAHTSFSAADFDLVGDTANGGLAVVSEPVTGGGGGSLFAGLIETDLEDQMKGVNASVLVRFPFTVADPTQLESLTLKMKYDDGYVAYLNGTEVARKNAADPLSWNSAATAERTDTQATTWENVDLTAHLPLLNADNGSGAEDNALAVHAMNYAAGDGDFLILPELSQSVYLGLGNHFFAIATPADVNSEEYWLYVEDTRFSHDRGFYETPFDLEITTDTVGADIYYTTDGSAPTEAGGTLYTTPIRIDTTTVVRAAAFKPEHAPTNVDTQTYLFLDQVGTQPSDPAGFPASWNGTTADYEMDPDVVDDPLYSDLLNDALRSIPTISIVANVDDLFGPNGIYSNPGGQGTAWERASSVEWINTDGSTGFQVDAGLRIYGGAFRGMNLTRKKTFRLLFKAQYGPTKLNFPMFGEGAATSFDNLVLRGGANDAWNNWGKQNTQYIVDEYMRRLQLDLGEPSGHGTFVHLYLNGLYWGLYNPIERPEASFDATYFGGEKEEWDGINAGAPTGESNTVTWNAMFDQVRAGLADNASYQKIQGNNEDGTNNPAYDDLLDVENYIAYMFSNFWGGTGDWPGHNYYAGCRRPPNSTGFKFFNWDAEGAIVVWSNLNANRTGVNSGAGEPYAAIRQNPEFRMLFADFVHRYMFNDGPGTVGPSLARYQELADEVELAIIAESARWGDQAATTPYTLEHWRNTRDYVLNTYMPQRPAIVLDQMKAAGFYPDVVAPSFSINASYQHGGTIDPGDSLTIDAPAGTIYYTTNGTDPRELYGAVSPGALVYSGAIGLTKGTHVKARAYDNGEWSALSEATYCIDLAPAIRITEVMYNPADPSAAEIAAGFADNDMFEFIELRNTGSQTLPLEGMRLSDGVEFTFPQISLAPGDYVVVVANQAAFQHRYSGFAGTIAGQFDSGTLNNGGERVQLDAPIGGVIHEFTYKDGWFGHTDGEGFSLTARSDLQDLPLWDTKEGWQPSSTPGGTPGAGDTDLAPGSIIINEILAHSDAPLVDMIELYNTTGSAIDVSGWFLSDAKTDDVGNPTLTKYQIPSLPPVAAGSYLLLREDTHFGGAFSLSELGDDVYLSKNAGSQPGGYREHVDFGASPRNISFGVFVKSTGGTDFTLLAGRSFGSANAAPYMDALAFNELQYHPAAAGDAEIAAGFTNADDFEFIEIINSSDSTRTLGDFYVGSGVGFTFGWYDADSAGNESWTLEAGATATWNAILPAGQDTYEVFARWDVLDGEGHERNLDGRASYAVTHAGGTTTVIRDQQPDPQEEGPTHMDEFGWVSLGNYVFNGSGQVAVTRGTNNPANWTIADQVRFVSDSHTEIVDDPSLDSWHTANGPATIGPGEYVVLVSNRAAFEARYDVAGEGIPLAGQYTGNLDNGGEKVKLFRRGDAEPTGFIPYYRVDYVNYDDNLPWPGEPDGSGSSLNRVNPEEYGNDPVNWQAGAVPGTPGADNVFVDPTPPTVPTGLDYALVAEPAYRIDLTWTASADPGSFVDHYVIYRDGMPHDTSPTNSYSDTDVALGGSWDYRVSAVNRDQIESDRSPQRHASIMDVVSAVGLNYTTIQVVLTETLDETSAETVANYALTDPVGQPVGIASAALEADGVTVTLTPSAALAGDTPYLLDVASVRDFAGNPVPPGMRAEIVLSASPVFIPAGSVWKYLDDGSDQGTAWKEASFPAESAWASGHAQLGYGDGGE